MQWNLTTIVLLILLGALAGVVSSIVGIGGGIIIVPALVFLFSMDQHTAQGTSLVMLLPPIGILAVMNYYKAGHVDMKVAVVLILAFVAGSYFGSKVALHIPEHGLKRIFGVFMLLLALKYLFLDK